MHTTGVLATRYRPAPIMVGMALAFMLKMAVAVMVGDAISKLSPWLVATLTNDILDAGEVPFLHVSHENNRAKQLYEHLGYRFRADIPLVSAVRLR